MASTPYEKIQEWESELAEAMRQPENYTPIFQSALQTSTCMRLGNRLRNMSSREMTMNIMESFPIGYFQEDGPSLKKTTVMEWKGKKIVAKEIAVLYVMPDDVLADAKNINLWSEITPRIGEAFGRVVDKAVLHGVNLPNGWLTDYNGTSRSIVAGAAAASKTVALGTGVDLYDDLLGESGVIGMVEDGGLFPTGHLAHTQLRKLLRHVRENRTESGAGQPIMRREGEDYTLDGDPLVFSRNGGLLADQALLVSGDWSKLVFSIRQDITPKYFDQGAISDEEGAIVVNLMQQDCHAFRFVFRVGFQIANPINAEAEAESTRYPFAVLTPAGT